MLALAIIGLNKNDLIFWSPSGLFLVLHNYLYLGSLREMPCFFTFDRCFSSLLVSNELIRFQKRRIPVVTEKIKDEWE